MSRNQAARNQAASNQAAQVSKRLMKGVVGQLTSWKEEGQFGFISVARAARLSSETLRAFEADWQSPEGKKPLRVFCPMSSLSVDVLEDFCTVRFDILMTPAGRLRAESVRLEPRYRVESVHMEGRLLQSNRRGQQYVVNHFDSADDAKYYMCTTAMDALPSLVYFDAARDVYSGCLLAVNISPAGMVLAKNNATESQDVHGTQEAACEVKEQLDTIEAASTADDVSISSEITSLSEDQPTEHSEAAWHTFRFVCGVLNGAFSEDDIKTYQAAIVSLCPQFRHRDSLDFASACCALRVAIKEELVPKDGLEVLRGLAKDHGNKLPCDLSRVLIPVAVEPAMHGFQELAEEVAEWQQSGKSSEQRHAVADRRAKKRAAREVAQQELELRAEQAQKEQSGRVQKLRERHAASLQTAYDDGRIKTAHLLIEEAACAVQKRHDERRGRT